MAPGRFWEKKNEYTTHATTQMRVTTDPAFYPLKYRRFFQSEMPLDSLQDSNPEWAAALSQISDISALLQRMCLFISNSG